jgi:hypothetical protein
MKKINFVNNDAPYLSAENLNQMQDNIEEAIGDTYSTEETFTGKYWIDGKKIYRKVINVGNLPNADVKNINHNIVGLENITFSYGNASNGSTHINLPNVHAADLISQVAMFVTNELIRITTGSDRSTYIGYVILEYTKATD